MASRGPAKIKKEQNMNLEAKVNLHTEARIKSLSEIFRKNMSSYSGNQLEESSVLYK